MLQSYALGEGGGEMHALTHARIIVRAWVRKRPSPILTAHAESQKREEQRSSLTHNAFPGRRRRGGREKLRKKKIKEKKRARRKATDGVRVSRAVRGSQYP